MGHLAVLKPYDPVGVALESRIVGDDHDRPSPIPEVTQKACDLLPALAVQ